MSADLDQNERGPLVQRGVIRQTARALAFLLIALAGMGVAHSHRSFAVLRVGPLFILDAVFLIWIPLACISGIQPLLRHWKVLLLPGLYFSWGMALLIADIIGSWGQTPWMQMSRHSILFIYPMMWLTVSLWMVLTDRKLTWLTLGAIFLITLEKTVQLEIVTNISIGPLVALPFLFLLTHIARLQSESKPVPRRYWVGFLALGLFTYYPFWEMWFHSMQRTILLILVMLSFGVPYLLCVHEKWNRRIAFKSSFAAITILLSGFMIGSVGRAIHIEDRPWESFKHNFYSSMQHGEDVPDKNDPKSQPFQARYRKFSWLQAIADWKRRPILGIGFIPSVPSYVLPTRRNTGGFEAPGDPPVNGPHNSYLNVLARMGVIGLLLLLMTGAYWLKCARKVILNPGIPGLLALFLFFVPLNGALHALFNIGFESPHNSFVMWLFAGWTIGTSLEKTV